MPAALRRAGKLPSVRWYNYENSLSKVDVIEPYNIGNNVEVIRSLNRDVVMISTHGFQHKPEAAAETEEAPLPEARAAAYLVGIIQRTSWINHLGRQLPDYRFVDEETRQLTPAA